MIFGQVSGPLADPSLFDQFGPWGVVLVVLLGAIAWLARDRAAIRAERDAERARSDALAERIVGIIERIVPVLDRTERALDRRERET